MLDLNELKRSTLSRFYTRGRQLYEEDSVKNLTVQTIHDDAGGVPQTHVKGEVRGSSGRMYKTSVFIRRDKMFSYGCSCPAVNQYPYPCKHCIALALAYHKQQEDARAEEEFSPPLDRKRARLGTIRGSLSKYYESDFPIKELIYQYSMREKARYFQADLTANVDLEPILSIEYNGVWQVEFKIGTPKKMYVLKNIVDFVQAVRNRADVEYGKNLRFIHEESAFTERALKLYQFLERCLGERNMSVDRYYSSTSETIRKLKLNSRNLADLFSIMWPQPLNFSGKGVRLLEFADEEPDLELVLEETEAGYELTVPKARLVSNGEQAYLVSGERIYRCSQEFKANMEEICKLTANRHGGQSFYIHEKDMPAFCASVIPYVQRFASITGLSAAEKFMPQPCQIRFFLDKEDGVLFCRPESLYGQDQSFNLLEKVEVSEMYRDVAAEGQAVWAAKKYFPHQDGNSFWMAETDEDSMYELFSQGIDELEQLGDVFLSAALNRIAIRKAPEVGIHVGLENGLLDLSVDMGDMPQDEMEQLLQAYQLKKKYYRLKNGDFLRLAESGLNTIHELVDGLGLKEGDLQTGTVQVPRYRSYYVDQVLRSGEGVTVSRSSSFKTLMRNIKAVEDSDYPVPEHLSHVLRSYQENGYQWLMTLRDLGFGGILADDMGLGKSLQILTFLCTAAREAKECGEHRTSLLICPASLVYNWQEEVNKFVPEMKTLLVTGTAAERQQKLEAWEEYDIIVTSYDLLKRDEDSYEGKPFYCQVLDEAQNIKNHQTKAAKAAKKIQAQVRFALTGTPIENRLSELWSIFDYLMPGLLGAYASFRRKYELPIVQNGDERISRRLQRMISPFILRRLKKDVLRELPEKNEMVVYARLEGEQEDIYRANARQLAEVIGGKSSDQFRTGKIEILSALTRLRQLCCDPHLVYDNYEGPASKLDTCMELVETAIESEQKVLLFSQFTSMLDIISQELDRRGISYYMLTGATGKQERLEMVHQFNEGETPLFLISLKAGGTGLNLTGATVVIHYDPWWNVAAENQASDRAHRIGQDKQVTVFKLIMQGTIEERIRRLQESKAHLADELVGGQTMALSELTRDDFLELLAV